MVGDFVILAHTDYGEPHFDLMLDTGEALRTWQLEIDAFDMSVHASQSAAQLPDHRRAYLDYEGPISRNRGAVRRVDAGTYELNETEDGSLVLMLDSSRGSGTFQLISVPAAGRWRLTRLA
jgi:hypothetical protein